VGVDCACQQVDTKSQHDLLHDVLYRRRKIDTVFRREYSLKSAPGKQDSRSRDVTLGCSSGKVAYEMKDRFNRGRYEVEQFVASGNLLGGTF